MCTNWVLLNRQDCSQESTEPVMPKMCTKTVDEGDMIDGVKGCTKVQRHKQGRGTKV